MIRRDYTKRIIEQFAEVGRRALGLKRENKPEAALEVVADGFARLLGLPLPMALLLASQDLERLLRTAGEPDPGRLIVAARLLAERAGLLADLGHAAEAAPCRAKAVELLRFAEKIPGDGPQRELAAEIAALSAP